MAPDPDEDRIRRKAHELWEADGHPHGRDVDHWEQAREIIAIQDSQGSTLLPRLTGVEEPVEAAELVHSHGDVPNLTDQGEHPTTSTSREPEALSPTFVDAMTSDAVKGQAMAAVKDAPAPAVQNAKLPSAAAKLTAKSDATMATKSEAKGKRSGSKKKK